MPADLPPNPPAIEQPAERPDPVAAYHAEVAALMSGETPEGFVDPHLADLEKIAPDDVDGRNNADDVDTEGLGPSDADLRAGDDLGEGHDALPGEGDEGDDTTLPDGQRPAKAGNEGEDEDEPAAPAKSAPAGEDPVEALAKTLRAANKKLTLLQAVQKAEEILGEGADTTTSTVANEPADDLPDPETLAQERRELDAKWRRAVRNLEDDAVVDQMEARIQEIDDLLPKAREAATKRVEQSTSAFTKAADKALQLYPDAAVETSPLYIRMAEIHEDLEANGDPLIDSPEKALAIAQMAARELKIAPRRAPAQAPAKPAQQAKPGQRGTASTMTAPLAPGAQRRTTTTGPTPIAKKIEAIHTPEDYDRTIRELRGRA